MTMLDINGNAVSKNRQGLTAKIKSIPNVEFEVQQWGRIWITLKTGERITFFADEEPKLIDWLVVNGKETTT